ncbi:MAG TPA: serine/threonine-protein kinase [Planctomycetota bacterium]|nr:serine/threonine-protein kinase [Planctomycetota bacterium]
MDEKPSKAPAPFHCPGCGTETPAGEKTARCPKCGREFAPASVQTVMGPQPERKDSVPPQTSPSPVVEEGRGEGSAIGGSTIHVPEGTPVEDAASDSVAAEPLPPALPKGLDLGAYILEGEIGRGGMGVVYRGTQKSLQRQVAIKVLPERLAADKHFVSRFEREALTLATLNHANIVQIIDRGICKAPPGVPGFAGGDICFLVMEFVEGVSLRHLLNNQKLSPDQALAIVPQICAALEYAHGKGVVHRDIKPENILLTPDGTAKITDFGLARIVHGEGERGRQTLTHSNVLMGTPDYMAPEQREKAKAVDHRADIFSLGVIFYEMLTGELPIGRFAAPSKKVQVDVRLDEVILKSLEKEPDLRYQRASHVSQDVSRISQIGTKPESAEPGASPAAPAKGGPMKAGTVSMPGLEVGPEGVKIGNAIHVGKDGVRIGNPLKVNAKLDAEIDAPKVKTVAVVALGLGLLPFAILAALFLLGLP